MFATYLKKLPILLYVILLLSLCLHLLFFIKHPGTIFNKPEVLGFSETIGEYGSRDAWLYAKMANQLIEEGVYGYDTHHTGEIVQNAFVTPGHPFYLVAIFLVANIFHIDQILLAKITNMILSIGTILIIYHIGTILFQKKMVGLLSAALYATYFSPLHYFRTLLTEIPAIFMFHLALLLFIVAITKDKQLVHVLFGICFSIAIMIRSTPTPLILLGIIIVVFHYGVKKSIHVGFLWLVGPLLIIVPWVGRNLITLGHPYLFSSHGGNSILNGANPFFLIGNSEMWIKRHELGMTQTEYGKLLIKNGFRKEFTLWFSWFTVGKTVELFKIVDGWIHYYKYPGFWLVKTQHFVVVLGGFLSGIIFSYRSKRVLLLWITLLGYIMISNMFLTIPRYGFFIIPLFCLLLGYGMFDIIQSILNVYRKSKA